MKKREVIAENDLFKLIKQTRSNKIWYELLYVLGKWPAPTRANEIHSYFGKSTNDYSMKYRFWNRVEAEKQFTYATLRWG